MNGEKLTHRIDDDKLPFMERTLNYDYRGILREALVKRCARNPRYSLRSFARDLGLSPARLSDVMNGRYGLSREAAGQIAEALGLSESESTRFCDAVDSQHARSAKNRQAARERLTENAVDYRSLTIESFKVISDWYHYAILELTLIEGFQSRPAWIAKKLGISPYLASDAIERLKRLDLLIENKDGRLQATEGFTASPDGIPSDALKKFQRQLLEKALDAIEFQSVQQRDLTSMIMAIDSQRLPEAKAELRKFRRHFDKKFGAGSAKKDKVYCLSLSFFRLQENDIKESPPADSSNSGEEK